MKHIRYVELPNFDHIVNLKQFFLSFDGLHNVAQELSYSVFSKYYCEAKCKVCYLRNDWDSNYDAPDKCSIEQLLNFASYFDTISSQDDLFLLKHKHPEHFKFYKEHGHLFTSCSMTDRAFIQQCNILLDDLTFKDIYEITFSEEFLESTGKLYAWILDKLEQLMAKYQIRKIKVVVSGLDPSPTTRKFLKLLNARGLDYAIYDDINLSRNLRHDQTPTNRFDYEGRTYPLFTETCYLQQSKVFLSLKHATKGVYAAHDIREFSPSQFLLDILKSKIRVYGVYADELSSVESKYVDYFKYVSSKLIVRDDFNFIPEILLGRRSVFYQKLVSSGFYVETPFGLLASMRDDLIIPIIELPKSKQKLEYFSIKCKKKDTEVLIPYKTESGVKFFLDNQAMTLYKGDAVSPLFSSSLPTNPELVDRFNSVTKSNSPETLRVSLGQACNYSCSYCSQKDLGDPTERPPRLASMTFVDSLQRNLDITGLKKIELWGGETLLYWNDIVNIIDNLDNEDITWYLPTNGTPLMMKHVEYLANIKGRVGIGISHDGPGHERLRGKEFLYKKVDVLKAIQDTKGKVQFGFNPVISATNYDLMWMNTFFRSFLDVSGLDPVSMNFELCRAYGDQGSSHNVIQEGSILLYREALRKFLDAHLKQFQNQGYVRNGYMLMTNLFHTGLGVIPLAKAFKEETTPITKTNCGVDDSKLISLELDGSVKICQNTDSRYVKGTIDKIKDVVMTGVKYRVDGECNSCPVVRLCKGSCPIDTGDQNFIMNHNIELAHYSEILAASLRLLFSSEVSRV